jgi:hypothetical protein
MLVYQRLSWLLGCAALMIFADKNKAAKPQMEDYRNPCELI